MPACPTGGAVVSVEASPAEPGDPPVVVEVLDVLEVVVVAAVGEVLEVTAEVVVDGVVVSGPGVAAVVGGEGVVAGAVEMVVEAGEVRRGRGALMLMWRC